MHSYELLHGPHGDVTNPGVLKDILDLIGGNKVKGVM